ncbi:MAG: alkene reductase [Halioglobus sp.]|nr:alkene reductase [Halioglobus sp.]
MDLFTPLQLGSLALKNRIVMAPMTRSRADDEGVPTDIMADYYRQRASAGMIVSEGIAPSADGLGYCRTPGLYAAAQVAAWRGVTESVHGAGGLMVAQLMHVGRVACSSNKPKGSRTVAPSPIAARGQVYTDAAGMCTLDTPEALRFDEIPGVLDDYRQATANAFEAGFDAVELHCTSGYLPAQFLSSSTNQRTDQYGGCPGNRVRFVVEALAGMISVDGPGRVGMRICPDNPFNDLYDEDPQETFECLLAEVKDLNLAYLHVIRFPGRVDNIELAQRNFRHCLIVNESYDFQEAQAVLASGDVAAVSFGRAFISNPDLVKRWRKSVGLSDFDPNTLYTPGAKGYSDYPSFTD